MKMEYFKVENNRKVVCSETPQLISELRDTDKHDWNQIYRELGFTNMLDYEDDVAYPDLGDFTCVYWHTLDSDLKIEHGKTRWKHHIYIERSKCRIPPEKNYQVKNYSISTKVTDSLTLTLEEILKTIRSLYETHD